MKKFLMIITALFPAVLLNVGIRFVLPLVFGQKIVKFIPLISILIALITVITTIVVLVNKYKNKKSV